MVFSGSVVTSCPRLIGKRTRVLRVLRGGGNAGRARVDEGFGWNMADRERGRAFHPMNLQPKHRQMNTQTRQREIPVLPGLLESWRPVLPACERVGIVQADHGSSNYDNHAYLVWIERGDTSCYAILYRDPNDSHDFFAMGPPAIDFDMDNWLWEIPDGWDLDGPVDRADSAYSVFSAPHDGDGSPVLVAEVRHVDIAAGQGGAA